MISISKEHIQIPGFFGFTGFYSNIPDSERIINFIVEFDFGDKSEKIEFNTKIIRPILDFEQSDYGLTINSFNQTVPPFNFRLKNTGLGAFKKLTPFSDVLETSNLKIKIDSINEKNTDESLVFVKTNDIQIDKIIIEGKGYGMLSVGYEYEDSMGNKYKTPFANVSFNIEETQNIEVPIADNISKSTTPLLQYVS